MKEDWSDHATREEVQRLREQIHYLKAHPHLLHKEAPLDSLLDSMERLQLALDKLVTLFEQANKEVYAEYEKGLHDQAERLTRIEEQNEKIARGIVAVADMLKQQRQAVPSAQPPAFNSLPAAPRPAGQFPAPVPPMPSTPAPGTPFPPHDDHTISPALAKVPPPLPPAPQPEKNGRRSVLDKFSFK